MAQLFFKMAINRSSKSSSDRDFNIHRKESSKIELFEGEKVFSHKIICIFWSGLTVCNFDSCQGMKKISMSWAMILH